MTSRLRSIDVVRGLAACSVVLYHANGRFSVGAAGVDFFFIVSGFVMVGAATGRTASEFLLARLWRVFPIYWVALLPWIVWAAMREPISIGEMLRELLLWPHWFGTMAPLLFLAWTLVFECLFYAAAAATIRLRSAAIPILLFVLAAGAWGAGLSSQLLWAGNPIILEFLFGVLIARLPKNETAGLCAAGAGMACFILVPGTTYAMEFQHFGSALTRVLIWGVPAALIVYGLVSMERRLTGRAVGGLSFLGGASYSIYLFHPLIMGLSTASWPIKFIAGIGLGVLTWVIFERPMLKVGHLSPWLRLRAPRPAIAHGDGAAR